jgi:hypothetical protein
LNLGQSVLKHRVVLIGLARVLLQRGMSAQEGVPRQRRRASGP